MCRNVTESTLADMCLSEHLSEHCRFLLVPKSTAVKCKSLDDSYLFVIVIIKLLKLESCFSSFRSRLAACLVIIFFDSCCNVSY
jgi:hypothetical protein